MKQKELMKQVVPLDLEGLEVLEGELLFVTGGSSAFWGADTGCECSNGWGCGCDYGWGCSCSSGKGCNCSGGVGCACS